MKKNKKVVKLNLKKSIKKLVLNKKIISFVAALISYAYLCFLHVLPAYNELSWLVLACMIFAFMKTDLTCEKHKQLRKEILILTLVFSFLLRYGNLLYNLKSNNEISILRTLFTVRSLLAYIGIFNLVYLVLLNIYPKLMTYTMKKEDNDTKKVKIVFFACLLIMFIFWLPYFLRYYPGSLSSDSLSELETIINNFKFLNDHHTVIHILFVSIPYTIGYKVFGTITAGIATHTIVQMLILASIFSYSIVFLYKRKVNKKILILILSYYAILPMHGFYSIVMWKDVMFAGLVLLLTIELIKIIEKEKLGKLTIKNMISFIIVSILCVFFRNNAIYMYFILIIFTFILFKKYYKVFLVSFIVVVGVYVTVKGPIFNALNIKKSASAEYIGIPLQQVGRMAYKNVEFTKEEKELIDKLIPLEVMANSYNPVISDGIKFNKLYNGNAFDNNKWEYFKLWVKLVLKHPSIAIEAYSISTLGYWYPGVEYWSVAKGISNNNLGIKVQQKTGKYLTYYVDHINYTRLPIIGIEWSIGLCFWIILIFALITRRLKDKKSLYIFVPVFGIWITMLVASPVFGEFRYVYNAFAILPLLMVFPYLKLKSS